VSGHDIQKALEVWAIQNVVNASIVLGMLALGLSMIQEYYRSLEEHLTLRVSIELWNVLTVLVVDVLLAMVAIVGFLVLNPDIMADAKIAIPFMPIATILFTVALFLRLFHGGHKVGGPNFYKSVWLMVAANVISIIGFTLIMEAPSTEYLAIHPSGFWTYVKAHLRSNANPSGLELSQLTFYVCFPILVAVYVWGFSSAMKGLKQRNGQ